MEQLKLHDISDRAEQQIDCYLDLLPGYRPDEASIRAEEYHAPVAMLVSEALAVLAEPESGPPTVAHYPGAQ